MKRIISMILAIVFIVSVTVATVPTVSAKENLNLSLTNASCKPGDTFTIDLKINTNPGIWALWFMMYYDSETFILRDAKLGADFADTLEMEESDNNAVPERMSGPIADRILAQFDQYGVSKEDNLCKIIMIEGKDIVDVEGTGVVATFTFEVNGDGIAKEGEHTIGLIPDKESIINSQGSGEYVPFTWSNATVSVGSNATTPKETQAPIEPLEPIEVDDEGNPVTDSKSASADSAQGVVTNEAGETVESAEDTKYPETFVGEDGQKYYTNENGETELFEEEDFMTPEELIFGTTEAETTAEEYLEGEDDVATPEVDSKTKTVLWIVVAAVLVLVAVAGILFVFINKSKKDAENIADGTTPVESETNGTIDSSNAETANEENTDTSAKESADDKTED